MSRTFALAEHWLHPAARGVLLRLPRLCARAAVLRRRHERAHCTSLPTTNLGPLPGLLSVRPNRFSVLMTIEQDLGLTPLYIATQGGSFRAAAILKEAGAKMRVDLRPLPGVRTILDIPIARKVTAAKELSAELGRRYYRKDF